MRTNTFHAKKVLVALFAVLMPLFANAEKVEINGIVYNLISKAKQAEVTGRGINSSSITIPAAVTYDGVQYSVTSIGDHAFYQTFLTAITIPESVTKIGNSAFGYCNITTITIPEGVTSIGNYAFYNCSNLTAITIPNGVTSIGYGVFSNCSSLTSITVSEGNYIYDSRDGCNAIIETSSIALISGCSTTIIPKGVTSIGEYAFCGCSGLTDITIPEGVKSIGNYAFEDCISLTAIVLPKSVKTIGREAFANCSELTDVYCNAETVPSTELDAFEGSYIEYATLHVPTNAVASYKTTAPWSSFGKFETMSIAVASITLSQSSATLTEGGTLTLIATVTPDDAADKSISWSSSNTTVVSVDANGQVTAIAPGTATITATANDGSGMKASCKVTVLSDLLLSTQQLQTGDTFTYTDIDGVEKTYKVVGENLIENPSFDNGTYGWTGGAGGALNNTEVNYSGGVDGGAYIRPTGIAGKSSDSSIGTAWDVEVGKTYIFSFFLKNQTNANAESPAGGGYIKVSMSNTYRDETLVLQPQPHVDAGLAWTQNTWVVTAEYSSLALCARWLGGAMCFDAFILAEVEEVGDNKDLEDLLVTSITLSQSSATLTEGESITLTATVSPEDADDTSVTWSSSNEDVAVVSSKGEVVAMEVGTATITATANDGSGVSAQCEVTVLPLSYAITYLIDGEVFLTDTLTRGSAITLPEVPTKEGYTFSGWGEVPETMPAEDVTINGTFSVNKYLVTFKIGDEVIASDSLEYGASIVTPEAPAKEGHTFNGWREVAETVPANDLTYVGSYSVNSYTLTYVVDEEVVLTLPIAYGATIPLLKAPTKEGYTFSGWGEVPETMPAEDVTIEGTFTRLPSIFLTINQADNGYVKQHLTEGTVCTYTIEAAEGWKIHTVTFNGEDVTSQLTEEGTFTTPELQSDAVLNIAYEKIDDAIAAATASRIKVQGHQGTITIAGAAEGAAIGLYTTSGTLVATATAEGDTTHLTVPTGQVYIVKVADTVVKIGM